MPEDLFQFMIRDSPSLNSFPFSISQYNTILLSPCAKPRFGQRLTFDLPLFVSLHVWISSLLLSHYVVGHYLSLPFKGGVLYSNVQLGIQRIHFMVVHQLG